MSKGRYGNYGGQYIPETLMNAVLELEEAYEKYSKDPEFNKELDDLLSDYDIFSKEYLGLLRRYKILNILTIGIYGKLNLYEYNLRIALLEGTLLILKMSHDNLLEEYENLKKLQYENQNNINCYKRNRDEISLFLEM